MSDLILKDKAIELVRVAQRKHREFKKIIRQTQKIQVEVLEILQHK